MLNHVCESNWNALVCTHECRWSQTLVAGESVLICLPVHFHQAHSGEECCPGDLRSASSTDLPHPLPSQSGPRRAGAAMHRTVTAPECASSRIEPGVATREGKGGHQTAEMNFLILILH